MEVERQQTYNMYILQQTLLSNPMHAHLTEDGQAHGADVAHIDYFLHRMQQSVSHAPGGLELLYVVR